MHASFRWNSGQLLLQQTMTELLFTETSEKRWYRAGFHSHALVNTTDSPAIRSMNHGCELQPSKQNPEMRWEIAGKCISEPLINITVWNNNMLCKYRTNMFAQPEVTCPYNIPDVMLSTAAPTNRGGRDIIITDLLNQSRVFISDFKGPCYSKTAGREWQGGIICVRTVA